MGDLLTGLALVLVVEGLLWAAFPQAMKVAAMRTAQLDAVTLRYGGLLLAATGVLFVWFLRR